MKKPIDFFRKNKVIITLLAITLFGAYLRLFHFHDLVRFNDDQVRDAQVVNRMIEEKEFPLLGPKAGGTKFNIGPAFYYLEYLSAVIFGNNPSGMAVFIAILAILSIPLLFYFLRFYFSENISLFASFLYAISFYAIKYSKFAWNPNAIPFFLLVFLIALLKIFEEKERKITKWHFILGISIGIGTQLHTLLLAIMPILAALVFLYLFFKKKKRQVAGFALALLIGLAMNSPLFIYDWKNNGENVKLFFKATETKTEKNTSLLGNFFKDSQFFIQGNAYVLSGFEPQKDWTAVRKFLAARNFQEIVIALAGIAFFLFGLILMVYFFRKEQEERKKYFLGLLLGFLLVCFSIFWPLANELQLRLFIVCFFFPFIFVALAAKFLMYNLKKISRFLLIFLAALLATLLCYSNYSSYKKAYDFSDYSNKTDVYGGISLKEIENISSFISDASKWEKLKNKSFYLLPFAYNKSIIFLTEKSGMDIAAKSETSAKKIGSEAVLVLISKSKNEENVIREVGSSYLLVGSENIGRFTVFLLQNK